MFKMAPCVFLRVALIVLGTMSLFLSLCNMVSFGTKTGIVHMGKMLSILAGFYVANLMTMLLRGQNSNSSNHWHHFDQNFRLQPLDSINLIMKFLKSHPFLAVCMIAL